ncbi:hypothetical protein Tco_0187011 [Tanacetum coccineum]
MYGYSATPNTPAVTTVKRTSCGAAVVAAMRRWWHRGVGCDEVMMGTVMWYDVDGDGAAEMKGDELVKMVVVVLRGVGMGGGAAVGGGYEGEARGGSWSGRSDRSGGGESFRTWPENRRWPEKMTGKLFGGG